MYRILFSLALSRVDAERAHHLAFRVIRLISILRLDRVLRRITAPPPSLPVRVMGLEFESPFGIAAGFDKDGTGILGLGALGFGHVEVGTVTARPQAGNARPRLFRLISDRAVINRMGFNNRGSAEAAKRIAAARRMARRPIIGANIGKSRAVSLDAAIDDYLESTRLLAQWTDYLVVNVSSPNTPGLRGLQELDRLEPLLKAVRRLAGETPVLVKIAPDLADDAVVRICRLAVRVGLCGIIAANTTLSREGLQTDAAIVSAAGEGGLSGPPLAARALELVRLIRGNVAEDFCVVSVGGVETAEDVLERLDAGANLVQGYTGFLYRGPLWARQVNRGLDAAYRARLRSGTAGA